MDELYRRVAEQRRQAQEAEQWAARWSADGPPATLGQEHVVGEAVLPRVCLMRDWISEAQHDALVGAITQGTKFAAVSGRSVAVLGGFPVLGQRMMPLPLPLWWRAVTQRLLASGAFDADHTPNHCLLNRYEPGCGISAHNDGPLYMPRVAILSLQSSCVFEFVDSGDGVVASVFVPKRSLLLFEDKAYSDVRHRVPFCAADKIESHCVNAALHGDEVQRTQRLSLTMRHVLDVDSAFEPALMTPSDRHELRLRESSFLRSISEK